MEFHEMKADLESRLIKIVQNFQGQNVTQQFIDALWAATQDEFRFFNDEYMRLSIPAVNWLHVQYMSRFVTLNVNGVTRTLGELVVFESPSTLKSVPLVDLYRMKSMFEHTPLVEDIDTETKNRMGVDGKTNKQASRGSVSTDN